MTSAGWVVLAAANAPVYCGLAWLFFGSWDGFWDAVCSCVTMEFGPDYMEGRWAQMKLAFWIAACALCVLGEAHLIGKWFG